ncbi:MAG TPA: rod shape-determining protein MreD [Oscillospiraceae bacterium]|nr:rod shape-determining protein MreD [Oscillospiraceae bacterium]
MYYNKKNILHGGAVILIIIISSLLQNTAGLFPEPFGARAFLLIPTAVYIGMFEKSAKGALFGAFIGILWDISSTKDGYFALMMFLTTFFCSLMISYFMRENFVTSLVLTSFCLALNIFVYVLIFYTFAGVKNISPFILKFYVPSFIYTLALSPIQYYLIKLIYKTVKTTGEYAYD